MLKVAYPAKQVDLLVLSASSITLWTVLPDGGGVEPVFQREGQRHSDLGAFSLYSFQLFCVCVLICFSVLSVRTSWKRCQFLTRLIPVLLERLHDYNESNFRLTLR